MRPLRLLFALLCGLLYAGTARAQESSLPEIPEDPYFLRLGTEDGLPDLSVWSILQDHAGFLWLGTGNGLVRYDGYEMKRFEPSGPQRERMVGRTISALHEDPWGVLWIGTREGGVARFDPAASSWTPLHPSPELSESKLLHPVTAITSGPDSTLWLTLLGGGLRRWDPQADRFRAVHVPAANGVGRADSLTALHVDGRDRIWVAEDAGGVHRFDPADGTWTPLRPDSSDPHHAPRNYVGDIHETRDGRLWFASQDGLAEWEPTLERFEHHVPTGADDEWARYLTDIAEDREGKLWIGSPKGLYRFDPDDGRFRIFEHDPSRPTSIAGGPVLAVACDRFGTVWAGSWQAGLSALDPWRGRFQLLEHDPGDLSSLPAGEVTAIHEDQDGTLWIGTGDPSGIRALGGLSRRPPGATGFERIRMPEDAAIRVVQVITRSPSGELWVGTDRGVWTLDPETDTLRRPRWPGQVAATLQSQVIYGLAGEPSGRIWVASSQSGLYSLEPGSPSLKSHAMDEGGSDNPSSLRINRLLLDSADRLWVGTNSYGLQLHLHGSEGFRRFYDPGRGLVTITGLVEGEEGRVYAATPSGVFRVDTSGEVEKLSDPQGRLATVSASGLAFDERGLLWIRSSSGLLRYDPGEGDVQAYDRSHGVSAGGWLSPALRDSEGRLYFGGRSGLLVVDPDQLREPPELAPVVITQLYVNGSPWEELEHTDESGRFPFVSRVTLRADQNDLRFGFAALSLVRTGQNRYRYRIEGTESEWNESGTRNEAAYTNLSPGSYAFEVQARQGDGPWNPSGARLELKIRPPWWASLQARALYLLLAVALTLLIYRQVIQRERMRTALELERSEARHLQALDELKSRFFTNISHEFRTPLSLIQGPLERLMGEASEAQRETLGIMHRNTRRLARLIEQLLDLSRLEAGRMPIAWQQRDCVTYLRMLASSFDTVAHDRGIEYRVLTPENAEIGYFAPDLLEKIVVNLLSNAFKFTPDEGRVELTIALEDHVSLRAVPGIAVDGREPEMAEARTLRISVANTGSFIPWDQRERIFDRFHQISGRDAQRGSGIGLALIHELVELQGGEIRLESEESSGTVFHVGLPFFLAQPTPGVRDTAELDEAEIRDLTEEPGATAAPSAPRLLVVEDNPDMRRFLADELRDEFQVLEAADGEEGWRLARDEIPDLVLSDVMMPGIDGLELTRRLKDDERTSHVSVILLTARAEVESRLEGLGTGADDYLAKPFDLNELRLRIRNLTEQRRRMQAAFAQRLSQLEPSAMPVVSADDRFLLRAREVVETHLDDPEFSVERFCLEIGLSRAQLLRKLKAITGLPPREFIRAHRLQRAAQLLRGGYGNVTEVAYAVGFQSLSNFALRFREQYGVPPSEYPPSGRRPSSEGPEEADTQRTE